MHISWKLLYDCFAHWQTATVAHSLHGNWSPSSHENRTSVTLFLNCKAQAQLSLWRWTLSCLLPNYRQLRRSAGEQWQGGFWRSLFKRQSTGVSFKAIHDERIPVWVDAALKSTKIILVVSTHWMCSRNRLGAVAWGCEQSLVYSFCIRGFVCWEDVLWKQSIINCCCSFNSQLS